MEDERQILKGRVKECPFVLLTNICCVPMYIVLTLF